MRAPWLVSPIPLQGPTLWPQVTLWDTASGEAYTFRVPVEFYERIVAASLGKRRGVVYVLPETRPVSEMFGGLELSASAMP